MNEEMCYITYVVPKSMLPPLPMQSAPVIESDDGAVYPDGFVPEWFLNASFPEDE